VICERLSIVHVNCSAENFAIMQSFAPGSVPPRNALDWVREGTRLVWRKITVHVAVCRDVFLGVPPQKMPKTIPVESLQA
jgi:hypothetical protein